MSLSKNWTVAKFWRACGIDANFDPNHIVNLEKFDIINRAVSSVAGIFYDLMAQSYMTTITILPDTTGRYSSSGTGSYTASTRTLVFNNMNTDFGSGDVGKFILFRVGSLVYAGQVATYVDGNTITLFGNNLPTSNVTVDYVLLASTTPTGNTISIADLKFMRTGQTMRISLESTATKNVDAVDLSELATFRSSASHNLYRIIWTIQGDEILLAKGDNITTYGTLTLRYPRIPNEVSLDSDYIDLPDGTAMDIAILKTKSIIADKKGEASKDYSAQYMGLVSSLYSTYGNQLNTELIQEKIKALV
jgi:hypothetical protein